MISNGSCTLCKRDYDAETRLDTWEFVYLIDVLWEDSKSVNIRDAGMQKAGSMTVYIPFQSAQKGSSVSYRNGAFLVQIEDKIAKGKITSIAEMENALTVIGVQTYDYGSADLHHLEVTCQ